MGTLISWNPLLQRETGTEGRAGEGHHGAWGRQAGGESSWGCRLKGGVPTKPKVGKLEDVVSTFDRLLPFFHPGALWTFHFTTDAAVTTEALSSTPLHLRTI